jgi:sterol 24-C-methyltransferase
MAPIALESEDHSRDAAFNKVLHGKSVESKGGFLSLINKDHSAHKAASDEYFKHWDNKPADNETPEIREVKSYSILGHCLERSLIPP